MWKRTAHQGRGGKQQSSLLPGSGTNVGFSKSQSFGGLSSLSRVSSHSGEKGPSTVSSLPVPLATSSCSVRDPPSLLDPSVLLPQGPVPRIEANPIVVPAPTPFPALNQVAEEIFPSVTSGKGLSETKVRKISKEKLKAVLTTIDCMEDEEMEEVAYDPIQHISSSTNPGHTSATCSISQAIQQLQQDWDQSQSVL